MHKYAKTILIIFTAAFLMLGGFSVSPFGRGSERGSVAQAATISSSLSSAGAANNNLKSGLVGHWTFDGADTTATQVLDKSGQNNTGTRTGGTSATVGKLGQAMKFNGSSNITFTSTLLNITGPVSVSAWVKVGAFSDYQMIVARGQGNAQSTQYELRIDPGGTADFLITNGSSAFNATKSVGEAGVWKHIIGVFDGTTLKVYVNGIKGTDATLTGTQSTTTQGFEIGSRAGGSYKINGSIDDVRVYSRALSASEVRQLYSLGQSMTVGSSLTAAPTPNNNLKFGLVGHWTFDGADVTATQVYDKSVSGNTGTIAGGVTKVMGKLGQGMKFDGGSGYVSGSGLSSGTNLPVTISAWIYPKTVSGGQYIFDRATVGACNGYTMSINAARLYGGGNTEYLLTGSIIATNRWQHVVEVFDGSTITGYVNGVKYLSPAGGSDTCGGTTWYIGSYGTSASRFTGSIDDVRIYSRALSASEVRQLYSLGQSMTVGSSLTAAPTPNNNLKSGLVGHWTFDGADTTATQVLDKSGQNNTGTLTGGVTKTIGKLGQAMKFDGSTGYITAANSAGIGANGLITISAWVNASSYITPAGVAYPMVVGTVGSTYELRLYDNTGQPEFWFSAVSPNSTISPNAITLKKWTHLVGVYDGSTGYIYVNGILKNSTVLSGWGLSTFAIGARTNGTRFFFGSIDDVRIYSRALSASEVRQLYALGK